MSDQEVAVWYNDNVIYPDKVRLNCYDVRWLIYDVRWMMDDG